MSAMECGLRIPVFIAALKILDNLTESERRFILKATYEHAWLTARRLSLYSSLGNHTVAECVGLIFAGGLFRDDPLAQQWLSTGIRILEQESVHQILDDGGPAEQSLNYHRFVLDLYWLAVDFLEKNQLHDCAALRQRLDEGEEFLAAFKGCKNEMPSIGDSDDGHAVAPGLSPERRSKQGKSFPKNQQNVTTYPESGYTLVLAPYGIELTFDHGFLGMALLYNHGHADALSITLYKDGRPFLIDPGTYRYNGAGDFRAYFKGTRAHNTVAVDGKDQAKQVTSFIWDRPYKVSRVAKIEGA
ncbi:MAG: alginate lyase family protein, partial [Desulfoferrobacter sp.]